MGKVSDGREYFDFHSGFGGVNRFRLWLHKVYFIKRLFQGDFVKLRRVSIIRQGGDYYPD
jgi:hypothetical protein